MFGMLVVVGLIALAIASAIIEDSKRLYKEYKHIQAEFKRLECNTMQENKPFHGKDYFDAWYKAGLEKAMNEFKNY